MEKVRKSRFNLTQYILFKVLWIFLVSKLTPYHSKMVRKKDSLGVRLKIQIETKALKINDLSAFSFLGKALIHRKRPIKRRLYREQKLNYCSVLDNSRNSLYYNI
jgi:hypothetical protein